MADPLGTMLAFPPDKVKSLSPTQYDTKLHSYLASLEKLPPSVWTKSVDNKSLLELLDPAVNSIAYLKSLVNNVEAVGNKDRARLEELYDQTSIFFASFDPVQVRFVGNLWYMLWDWAIKCSSHFGLIDLSVLSTALLRLDPSSATFTTLHLSLVQQSLALGTPTQALPILDKNIFAYPQTLSKSVPAETVSDEHELSNAFITSESGFSEKVVPEHVLEYYLLGAHVYIGTRNYQRARLFLEHVILFPTQQHCTSTLQVEAFKKWILIGLLSEGKSFPYPRTVDAVVWKNIKSVAKAYDALADSFEKRDWQKYQAEMDVGAQIWADDGNTRLVEEAGHALVKYRVSDLQKTYAVLPVSRVAAHLGLSPEETLSTLTQMMSQESLNATLTQGATPEEGILQFHQPSLTATAPQSDLEAQTKRIETLIAAVRDADRRLQLTKEHVAVSKRNKSAAAPDAELADQMDLTWDAPGTSNGPNMGEDDEDIMS